MSSIFRNILKLRKAPRFMRTLLFKRFIYFFQMGKAGSTSARFAVKEYLERQDKGYGHWSASEIGNTVLFHTHRISYLSDFYRRVVLWRVRLGLPLTVICSVREPIARDVSAFFHFYCQFVPELLENTSLRELEELFLLDSRPKPKSTLQPPQWLPHAEHEFTLSWFDKYFKPLTRIDVYKQPFPIDRKWQVYRRGFTRVLLYRTDLERSEQTKLISRFLSIKLDEMRLENSSEDKDYAELYSRFRESVKLPEQYIRRMHDSRFAKHFWSTQELKVAADKWRVTPSS